MLFKNLSTSEARDTPERTMQPRIITLVLLLGLGAFAWYIWLTGNDPAPNANQPSTSINDPAADIAKGKSESATAPSKRGDEANGSGEQQRTQVVGATAFAIRGRTVRSSNKPLPKASVRARAYAGTAAVGTPLIDVLLESDAEGRFVWSTEPPNVLTFFDVRGTGDRIRTYAKTFVLVPGDPPPEPFDVWVVPLTANARGVVLDPEDQPIAGARVGSTSKGASATTDANGRFDAAVPHKDSVRLYVSAPGFVELRQEVAIDLDTGIGETELRMRLAHRIHGRITDPNGRPIADAVVRTFHTIFTTGSKSDHNGHFVLDNLDPSLASHSLFARKPGYIEAKSEVKIEGSEAEQDLVLTFGVKVQGTVVGPSSQPVAAASVFLGFSPSAYDRIDATTDLMGRFEFACVAPGEHTVNVERRGFSGLRQKIEVPKPPSPPIIVPLRLETGHFLGGQVLDDQRKAIAGVSIAPRLDGEYLSGIRAKTDAQGRFRLEGLPAKGLDLEFHGNGVLRRNVPIAKVDHEELEVTLERHGRIAGKVVDGRTGAPITEFRIRFGKPRLMDGEQEASGYSAMWVRGGKEFHADDGEFHVSEGMKIGSVMALEASAKGFGAGIHDHVVATLQPDPEQVVIRLYPGVVIEGVVRAHGSGLPIANVELKAFPRSRPLRPHAPNDDLGRPITRSDAAGRFRFENVGPGEYSIESNHTNWLPTTVGPFEVTVDANPPNQEIELEPGVEVSVDLRDVTGQPLVGAKAGLSGGRIESDATGTVRFMRVAPGRHQLSVWIRGSGTFHRIVQIEREARRFEFVPADGDATLVVFVDYTETLPTNTQLFVLPKQGGSSDGAFASRIVPLQAGRNVIQRLPATDLRVHVFGPKMTGNGEATTVAGQVVETRIQLRKSERR